MPPTPRRTAVLLSLVALLAAALPAAARTSITVTATQIFGTIDPAKVKDYTEYMAAVNLYDGLVTVDPKGNVLPQLAERWDISPDAKTYTFHLGKAQFQSGRPVRAADVVYSLQRLLALGKGPAFLFTGLIQAEHVKALDEATVEIGLDRVYAPFLGTTALIFVVDSEALKAAPNPAQRGTMAGARTTSPTTARAPGRSRWSRSTAAAAS